MATETSWVAILGAASGLSAIFLRLVDYVRKPRLVMGAPYARVWRFPSGITWNFINLEATCRGGLAAACEAKAIVIRHPKNVSLVRELTEVGCGLHWADIPYSGRSTGVDRVDIGSAPQRLDVAFTVPSLNAQAHLAMPIALSALTNNPNIPVPQTIFPLGEYVLKITINSANAKGDTKTIRLLSSQNWQDMNVERIRWYELVCIEINWRLGRLLNKP